jgi:flagellin
MVSSLSGKGFDASLILQLNKSQNRQGKIQARLGASEKPFSEDVAAGAISEQLKAIDSALNQGSRNARDFLSVAELRDSAGQQVSQIRDRQAELAAQASNGTLSDADRAVLNQEFQALEEEITRIEASTEFNGINLFDGATLTAQVGTDSTESSQIELESYSISSSTTKDISTQDSARAALVYIQQDQADLSQVRARDGAAVARLNVAAETNDETRLALQAANARLRDPDVASDAANLTRENILQQTQTALLAQANTNSQSVLGLLK